MKLSNTAYQYDFGHEYYLQLLPNERLTPLQLYLAWDQYPFSVFPNITLQLFSPTSIFNFRFSIYKFTLSLSLLVLVPLNLNYYK